MSERKKAYTLYRFWDHENVLLYVGMTGRPQQRFKEHSGGQGWWRRVHRVTVEHFDDPVQLAEAEVEAIKNEAPLFNIARTPRYRRGPARETTSRHRVPRPRKLTLMWQDCSAAVASATAEAGVTPPPPTQQQIQTLGKALSPDSFGMFRSKVTGEWSVTIKVREPSVETGLKPVWDQVPVSQERAGELLDQLGTPWDAVDRSEIWVGF